MIFDPAAGLYYKISPLSALIISKLDRDYELREFTARLKSFGIDVDDADVAELVGFLSTNNLLAPEFGRFEQKLSMLRQAKAKTWFLRLASLYVYFRLPPWHPEKFLRRIAPYVGFMAQRWFVLLLLLPALLGYLLALRDFSTVRSAFVDSLSWAGLVKYFLAIILLKVIHESAHSLAATHFQCRVRAIGVGFIFFYPRIFTDTTDSWRLERRKRLLIDAAGLIAEVICGGLAALWWSYLPPGAGKSTTFYIFAVSTLSTLLVNGNPLIRYDGYYILCDLLNTENLMGRSVEYVKQFWRYVCFRLGTPPQESRPIVMLVFGISTFIYRILLYTSIIIAFIIKLCYFKYFHCVFIVTN